MQTANIRPSTVDGIKQLAKKLKRENSISHTEALDLASRQAGFENFVHAKRRLGANQSQPRLATIGGRRVFPTFVSAHWHIPISEPRASGRRAGREILQVNLSRPLSEVVAKHRVSSARGLSGFRMEYADHLEHLTDTYSIDDARKRLVAAVRSLRFMEASGLQPATTARLRSAMRTLTDLPGTDHSSQWFDATSGSWVFLDEPYDNAVTHFENERLVWLTKYGFNSVIPSWEGLYLPGACPPHLISPDASLLQRITGALTTVAPYPIPEPWPNETGFNGDDFVSPQRLADSKPRRPRPGPSFGNYKGATAYGGEPGIRSRRRPSQPMPLESHRELGELMQSLSSVPLSWRVGRKLGSKRYLLEEWALAEHRREHGASTIENFYYGGPSRRHLGTRDEQLDAIARAKALVEHGYNDCKPRRELIAALDAATAEISATSASPL